MITIANWLMKARNSRKTRTAKAVMTTRERAVSAAAMIRRWLTVSRVESLGMLGGRAGRRRTRHLYR
jgi:hypothetical protein